ncbi:hypothetical protein IA57_03280 [Mangrovimonas yunxiaonensis]|uniref:Ribosome maturation factor RimP n=1 Tax=Mangrovimonas yunxiaonensis TaxID=1197477 RepID=A0A084TMG9_9FLAO|nr:ribosome assembly cofactor RimP [Mangrovimonas yunxiaonensis]KFB01905.1 hypothetical protein IA57_03280 [Mangrovimonas yunxiaonensis]MBR9757358.1 ribosome assembly cofactor RimP [Algicola sp.]GGH44633.1 ribosome maturation factor RimP [Mangrovimonas yunxiaonensis]
MFKTTVENLLEKALEERSDLFLIELSVGDDYGVKVVIDGDKGVTVEDCIFVSRAIEHNLDREAQDFSLVVTSAGAASPLVIPRQFKKNIGRVLNVKTADSAVEGSLVAATDQAITLAWKAREPKPVGKGKHTVNKEANIAYENIVEAKVMIKF